MSGKRRYSEKGVNLSSDASWNDSPMVSVSVSLVSGDVCSVEVVRDVRTVTGEW